MKKEGFAVIYRNEDGSFSFGPYIHKTSQCAINNIPIFEGKEVVDTIPVTFEYDESKILPGCEYRIQHLDELKEFRKPAVDQTEKA